MSLESRYGTKGLALEMALIQFLRHGEGEGGFDCGRQSTQNAGPTQETIGAPGQGIRYFHPRDSGVPEKLVQNSVRVRMDSRKHVGERESPAQLPSAERDWLIFLASCAAGTARDATRQNRNATTVIHWPTCRRTGLGPVGTETE